MFKGCYGMNVNLNDPHILASSQACFLWEIHDSSLRKKICQFPEGTIRRLGKSWIVTSEGMQAVFGEREKWFNKDELTGMMNDVQGLLKEQNSLPATQLFKMGVDYLTNIGHHSVIAQDVVRVVMNQMNTELFFQIYQYDDRRQ